MEWDDLVTSISDDLISRNLKSSQRLNELSKLDSMMRKYFPNIVANPSILLDRDINEFKKKVARVLNKKLNDAESSIINNFYQFLRVVDTGEMITKSPKPSTAKAENKKKTLKKIDLKELKKKISEARNKYKPEKVNCIFFAEAPPDSVEIFFYYEDVRKADYLFLGIMEVLYPNLKSTYINKKRPIELKSKILDKFKNDGYYLLDLLDVPKGYFNGDWGDAANSTATKLESEFDKRIPIIITKANVYDLLYTKLIGKGFSNVSSEKLPFPSTGGQKKFREGFKRSLNELENSILQSISED